MYPQLPQLLLRYIVPVKVRFITLALWHNEGIRVYLKKITAGLQAQATKLHLRKAVYFRLFNIVFVFGAFQAAVLYVQNRIICKNTRNRIIDKIQNMES